MPLDTLLDAALVAFAAIYCTVLCCTVLQSALHLESFSRAPWGFLFLPLDQFAREAS